MVSVSNHNSFDDLKNAIHKILKKYYFDTVVIITFYNEYVHNNDGNDDNCNFVNIVNITIMLANNNNDDD